MKPLTHVYGIGPGQLTQLAEHGLRTTADLAAVDDLDMLAQQTGIPTELLCGWRELAKKNVATSSYRRRVAMILGIIALLIVTTSLWWSSRTTLEYRENPYFQALEAYDRGDYTAAAQIVDVAFQRSSPTPDLHNLRGELYRRSGNNDAARREYEAALKLDPSYAWAWNNLGNVDREEKKLQAASENYQQAIKFMPKDPLFHSNLASLLNAQGNIEGTIQEYQQAIELGSKDAAHFTVLAELYLDKKQYTEAEQTYRTGAPYAENQTAYWQDAARSLRNAKAWDQAQMAYNELMRLAPDDWKAHFYHAWVELQRPGGSSSTAVKELEALIHDHLGAEDNKWAYLNIALAQVRLGNPDAADKALEQALKIDPRFVVGLQQRAYTAAARGKYDVAERLYNDILRESPTDTSIYPALIWLYREQSKFDRVTALEAKLEQVAKPNDINLLVYRAWKLQSERRFREAAKAYEKVFEINPDTSGILTSIGSNWLLASEFDKGMDYLKRAMQTAEAGDAYTEIGHYYHVGPQPDLSKAEENYLRALEAYGSKNPDSITARNNLSAIYMARGTPEALEAVIHQSKEVLDINPKSVDALDNIGYASFHMGDLSGAVEAYDKAILIAPNEPILHWNKGEVLIWLGRAPEAITELETAEKSLAVADSSDVWVALEPARYRSDGKQRFVYYATLEQKYAAIELLSGLAYMHSGDLPRAQDQCRRATQRLSPRDRKDREVVSKAIGDLRRMLEATAQPEPVKTLLEQLQSWLNKS